MNNLLVMKFGGTSMGSADRMRVAAQICREAAKTRPVVVVVSAMSKVTDLLLDTLRRAEAGDQEAVDANLHTLVQKHVSCCDELLAAGERRTAAHATLNGLLSEFTRIARGILMLGERPPRSVDEAIAIGERLSASLLAAFLQAEGVKSLAVNAAELIVTDDCFGEASPLLPQTRTRVHERLLPQLEQGVLPVITGFNGATADGRPTTLGRGGSDFSASIMASVLDAAELWIWTDVDGIMSADPRLVPDAVVLDEVTYSEAAELAYAGAKVLHPRTLAPLVEQRIPVWSKNSFNVAAPGTRIVAQVQDPKGARAVTSMAKVALISLESTNSLLSGTQMMARALEALARVNAEPLAVTSSSYRQSFCFLVRAEELLPVLAALEERLAIEITHGYVRPIEVDENVGLLAVVGEGMRGTPGLAGRIFTAISREQVNIIAIAQGSSEQTISIVVRRDGLEKAVKAVHAECGLGQFSVAVA